VVCSRSDPGVPSLDEGFAFPVLEAMRRCARDAQNRSSLAEIALGRRLASESESAEQLAEALRRMVADDQLREDLKLKGLARAATFPVEDIQKNWDVYRELT